MGLVAQTAPFNPAKRVLFFVLGCGLLLVAALTAWSTHAFVKRAERAHGVVVFLDAGGSHPHVQFSTRAGQVVDYSQGGLIFGFQQGDTVTVLYDPRDAGHEHTIDNVGALWFWPIQLTVLGVGFLSAMALTGRNRLR